MKKVVTILFITLLMSSQLVIASSNDSTFGGVLDVVNEKDLWAVRDWMISKRKHGNKGCDIMVSGEVRAEWRNVKERLSRIRQVGEGSVSGLSNNLFDVEVNLFSIMWPQKRGLQLSWNLIMLWEEIQDKRIKSL